MTRETICSAVKLNVLLVGGGEACFRTDAYIGNLFLDYMLPKSLVLICRTASIVCNMRSPTICALRLSFFFIWAVFV